ncbi:MAG: hypothetical protein ACYTG2_06390 [Planctomycetota bacterium]|jgi:hypothetical protein
MRLRLTHILVLMTLILAAGVLSVRGLEAYVGATSVPAVIVVDVSTLQPAALQGLGRGRGGPAWFLVQATDEPCAPFDRAFARRAAAGGATTLLLSANHLQDATSLREAWQVLIAPESVSDDAPVDVAGAADRMAAFVAEQHGTRPFLAGLVLGEVETAQVSLLVGTLLDAASSLPNYRRTSLVLLGAHVPDGSRRVALRFDVGRWKGHMRPALADLLEDIP